MKKTPPSLEESRRALTRSKVPSTEFIAVRSGSVDLPDAFLCELGRFLTRFARVRAALCRSLHTSTIDPDRTLDESKMRMLDKIVARCTYPEDRPTSGAQFMELYRHLAKVALEFSTSEWATPTAYLYYGAELEGWPPSPLGQSKAQPPKAANDSRVPREEPGTRVPLDELRLLSGQCATLFTVLWGANSTYLPEHLV